MHTVEVQMMKASALINVGCMLIIKKIWGMWHDVLASATSPFLRILSFA